MGVPPIAGWFIMENPSINGWFRGSPILGSPRICPSISQDWAAPRTIGAGRLAPRSPCASWHRRCGRLPRRTSRCAWEASPGLPGNAQQTCRSRSSGGTWSSCRSHNQSWGKGWNPWIVCAHDHRCLWACAMLGSCAWSDQLGTGWTSWFASSQSFSCLRASAWLPQYLHQTAIQQQSGNQDVEWWTWWLPMLVWFPWIQSLNYTQSTCFRNNSWIPLLAFQMSRYYINTTHEYPRIGGIICNNCLKM